ncbi:CNH domain-containing protein [Cokeromyces recurvatus]|uniref:CNH domain-containing protein n=1 Tax=Cokeromyces recurvatus TaxID=90255 RepID=UPI0022211183|nr:CNH domain-containing protein [Cokeromyces recurvatus]KAI7903065.1 CNH domain-containing protein [Cokeromyces recurvatus]
MLTSSSSPLLFPSNSSSPRLTPTSPLSPSFIRTDNSTNTNYTNNGNMSDDYIFTTRSSSLNRATSSSGKSIIVQLSSSSSSASSPRLLHHKQPLQFISNPASPLAYEIKIPIYNNENLMDIPNYAFLSYIAEQFMDAVKSLNERRRIYCSAEYPSSFNGEEAIEIIRSFSPPELSDGIYQDIAQSLMCSNPPLIVPIDSSERSIRKNKFYANSTEAYTLVEATTLNDMQGIYTPLTRCYSMSCLPGQAGCYSASCPNKLFSLNGSIFKKPNAMSVLSSSSYDTTLSRAWSATVPKEVLKSLPDDEIKRQEAIHEVIYTEDDYVRDLKILDNDFAKELLSSQCIEEFRKKEFHDKVLNNYEELLYIHDALYKELRDYQAICQVNNPNGIVDKIGDIFLRHVSRFKNAYLRYGPHVVLAEYYAKLEADTNMVFRHFIKARESLAQCRRLPFRHFIILPVTRLQRYGLLLGAVLKKTPEDHPDKIDLTDCIELIRHVAEAVDEATVGTKNTLRIYEIQQRLRFKPDDIKSQQLLDLNRPGRRLIKEGVLIRKSHVVEAVDIHLFLFDHALLMTKVKKSPTKKEDVEYAISKNPIPLHLLHVQDATEGFSIGIRTLSNANYTTSTMTSTTNTLTHVNSSTFGVSYPILLHHLGRHGGEYILYADNAASRLDWKEKIIQAKSMKEMAEIEKRVFEIRTLSDNTFANNNSSSSSQNHGKVTCTVPFIGPTGIRMIAIGTQQGIWMGIEGDTNTIRLALTLSDVQQIAVLEDHHIFLILADKTLYAYALDPLIPREYFRPQSTKSTHVDKPHQKIAQHISFFHSGICNGRTIIIAMKKRGVDSNFKVFEPLCGDLRNPVNSHKFLSKKSGFFQNKIPSWFKICMEFYIGTESYAIQFLKARIVVICSRGFEIINLEALNMNRNLPDMAHPDFAFIAQHSEIRPLGMYRCREYYLLCYDMFAFMVDVHGTLVKDAHIIEWEGVPQSVAFYYPYVIGFDSRFIEVRHIETGELVQILAGTNIRCLQFIQHSIAPVIHGSMGHPFKPDFQYIFQLAGLFEPPLLT